LQSSPSTLTSHPILKRGMAERYAATNKDYDILMEAFRNDENEIAKRVAEAKKKSIPFLDS